MAIVSSEIIEQLDLGHIWQGREAHTDSQGAVHPWLYHPPKSVNLTAKLSEHATILADQLAQAEIDGELNG